MKVGKEELFGILAAVEWSLAQDEDATIARYEQIVQSWISGPERVARRDHRARFPERGRAANAARDRDS